MKIRNYTFLKKQIKNKLGIVKFLLVSFLLFISCQARIEKELSKEATLDENLFLINNSDVDLSSRITYVNRTANIKPIIDGLTDKSVGTVGVNGAQEDYYWEHVAEVAPLEVSGKTLSATHITLQENKAYVSYHKQGIEHIGAVEILDLKNPNNPEIVSQATFLHSDINAITSDYQGSFGSRKVWLAMSDSMHGAQLVEIETNGGLFTDKYKRVNLSNIFNNGVSASANGIAVTDDYLFVTSGKTHGGTIVFDKETLEPTHSESYSDAKYVAVNGKETNNAKVVSLITGDNAKIKVANVNSSLDFSSFDIGKIIHQNVEETYRGKSTISFSPMDNNALYLAKGKDGLELIDVNSGAIKNQSSSSMITSGNTNAVSSDNDYVYTANGADGIAIAHHPVSNGEEIQPIFTWDLEDQGASANYIVADGEWVFVAKGNGGFKILRKRHKDQYKTVTPYNNQGRPEGMEEDKVVCSTLLPNIYAKVLPEGVNAMQEHPEFFNNAVKNLVVSEETELFLTFIDEGAGYKNVLGYYTYQVGNEPTSVEQLDQIVIFPNTSAQGSGGQLIKGNTMRLLGKFKPGTVIEFFLISNGWRNGSITDGLYTQFTNIDFNESGVQQSLIFYDATCNSTVISFEDISVPHGDNDFNDAIFEISASNPNALNTASFNQIGD